MTKLRHVLCLLFTLTVLTASAQTAPVQWNLADFTVNPLQYSIVTITKLVPSGLGNGYTLANSSRSFQTDSNGFCLVTNMAMGYPYQVKFWDGNLQQVEPTCITNTFPIQLAGTNVIDAQNWLFYYILTQGPVIIGTNFYASNFVSFAQVQAAAYNAQTNAQNYAFTNTLAVSNSLFLLIPSTNGFISLGYYQGGTNILFTLTTNLSTLTSNGATAYAQAATNTLWTSATNKFYYASNPAAYVNQTVTNGLVSSNNAATTNGYASIALVQVYTNTVNGVITTASNVNNTTTILASNVLQSQISTSTASPTNSWSLNGTTIGSSASTLGTSNKVALNVVVAGTTTAYFGTNQNISLNISDVNNGAQYSFAEGYFTSASGNESAAFNGDTTASGVLSFSANDSTLASGQDSFSCGDATVAKAYAFSAGVNSVANTNSFAWADNTQPVGYQSNRQTNTFSVYALNGVQINATNGYTNALFVNGTIYATTNIYVNGLPVITTATAGVQGVGVVAPLLTAATNTGVVTITAVSQTNSIAANSITGSQWALTNAPTLQNATNNGTFTTFGAVNLAIGGMTTTIGGNLTAEGVSTFEGNVIGQGVFSGNGSGLTNLSAGAFTNAIFVQTNGAGQVTNNINAGTIQVGGNTNFYTSGTLPLRVTSSLNGVSGTLTYVSSTLYTNANTPEYYTNGTGTTWTLYYPTAIFISTSGLTNANMTPVSSGTCSIVYGNYQNDDGVVQVGEQVTRYQQVFYGPFNSPVGNVSAFPPALYYKIGAGSLWEKTNTTFDANGWDCQTTNRPGT